MQSTNFTCWLAAKTQGHQIVNQIMLFIGERQ